MTENLILSTIPFDSLKSEIRLIIKEIIDKRDLRDLQDKLLSPSETCKLFSPSISKATLSKWAKRGYLKEYRIGGRVFFKYSEILSSLKSLEKYKYKTPIK